MRKIWPIKKKKQSPSLPAGSSSYLTGASPQVPVKLLTRAHEVTMDRFIACICDNDLSVLADGPAKAEELAEAWTNLFYEYCDLSGNSEKNLLQRTANELHLMQVKHECASGWLSILEVTGDEEIAGYMRTIGYDFEFTDTLAADCKRVRSELSLLKLQIRIKEADFESMSKNQPASSETVERVYFAKVFHAFSAYYKYQWFPETTTVERYCMALRDMTEASERLKNKQ